MTTAPHNTQAQVLGTCQPAHLNDTSLLALSDLYDAAKRLHEATQSSAYDEDGYPLPMTQPKAYRSHRLAEKVMVKAAKLMKGEF